MTRDHPETEKLLLNVVEQVSKATLERIARSKSNENDDDDQAENDITQGNSVVFSMLEISLYVVSKYASEMIPAASKKPNLHAARKSYKGDFIYCTILSCLIIHFYETKSLFLLIDFHYMDLVFF